MDLELTYETREEILSDFGFQYDMNTEEIDDIITSIESKANEVMNEPDLEEYIQDLDSDELQEKFDEVVIQSLEEYLSRADAKNEDIEDYINSTLVGQRVAYVFRITDQYLFDKLIGKINVQNAVSKEVKKQAREDNPALFEDTRSINKLYK